VAAEPDRYELHYEDETHVETNPYLSRVWHRRGRQPTVPAVGTNRRVTVFGSVEAFGRGRVEVHIIWLSRYSPQLNPKEREWRYLKRDARGHLAPTLRDFVDGIRDGLDLLGGERRDIIDEIPDWFLAGHRRPPTGRPPGRPKGAKDSRPRAPYRRQNLPALT